MPETLSLDWTPDRRTRFDEKDLRLEQLLNEWDPLGVYWVSIEMEDGSTISWPDDEYDDLVRPVRQALEAGYSAVQLEDALEQLIEADYGISLPLTSTLFTERVLAWWQASHASH